MTTSDVDGSPSIKQMVDDLRSIYGYFCWEDRGFALTVGKAAKRSLPRIAEMLEELPPPADPPQGESSVVIHEHNIACLSQWVEGLETALHRVEERLETVEAYNSQSPPRQTPREEWNRKVRKSFLDYGIPRMKVKEK